jgi:hypothetical protein
MKHYQMITLTGFAATNAQAHVHQVSGVQHAAEHVVLLLAVFAGLALLRPLLRWWSR